MNNEINEVLHKEIDLIGGVTHTRDFSHELVTSYN